MRKAMAIAAGLLIMAGFTVGAQENGKSAQATMAKKALVPTSSGLPRGRVRHRYPS